MKFNPTLSLFAAAALLGLCIQASAQTAVTTTSTTESAGTISDFGNDVITVRTEHAPAPVSYHYTKTTTYVDDAGAPVSIETVKSGLPVTVHYVRAGDGLVADRVIVHRRKVVEHEPAVVEERRTTTAPAVVEERKTTTTTTTESK